MSSATSDSTGVRKYGLVNKYGNFFSFNEPITLKYHAFTKINDPTWKMIDTFTYLDAHEKLSGLKY
ncbi:MAG: hypothetical protein GYA02_03225 [Clostridiaceae bacterium]|jgi:hypothetical protein|nr:hypothetical protein [Clostridiaceae bacterium]